MDNLNNILQEYAATAANPSYKGNWSVINSKFPELKGFDSKLLQEYAATAANPSYKGNWSVINSKFPELFPKNLSGKGVLAPTTNTNLPGMFDMAPKPIVQKTTKQIVQEHPSWNQNNANAPEEPWQNTVDPTLGEQVVQGAKHVVDALNTGASDAAAGVLSWGAGISKSAKDMGIPVVSQIAGLQEKGLNAVSDYFRNDANATRENANPYGDKGSIQLIKEGHPVDAAANAFLQATQSLPLSLTAIGATVAGHPEAGLGVMYASSAGNSYREVENDPNMSEFQKQLYAHGSGVIQAMSELLGDVPIGNMFKSMYMNEAKKVGAEAAKKIVTNRINDVTKNAVKSITDNSVYKLLMPTGAEAMEEGVGQLGQNILDYATGKTTTYDPLKDVGDNMLYGAAGGAQFSGAIAPGIIHEKVKTKREYQKADAALTGELEKHGFDAATIDQVKNNFISQDPAQRVAAANSILQSMPNANEETISKMANYFGAMDNYEQTSNKFRKSVEASRQQPTATPTITPEQQAEAEIRARVNPDMNAIVHVDIAGMETPMHIAKGRIATNEDGSIDRSNSDEAVYYTDPTDGKTKVTAIDNITGLKSNVPTDEAIAQMQQQMAAARLAAESPLNPPQGDLQTATSPQPFSQGEGQTSPNPSQGWEQSVTATPQFPKGDLQSGMPESLYMPGQTATFQDGSLLTVEDKDVDGIYTVRYESPNGEKGYQQIPESQMPYYGFPEATQSPLNPPQGDLQTATSPQPLSQSEGQPATAAPKSNEGDLQSETSPQPISEGEGQPVAPVIPTDATGKRIFEQAPVEATIGAFKDVYDTPEKMQGAVYAVINKLTTQLSKTGKQKLTGDPETDMQNSLAVKQQADDIKSKLEYWTGVKEALAVTPKSTEGNLQTTKTPEEIVNDPLADITDRVKAANELIAQYKQTYPYAAESVICATPEEFIANFAEHSEYVADQLKSKILPGAYFDGKVIFNIPDVLDATELQKTWHHEQQHAINDGKDFTPLYDALGDGEMSKTIPGYRDMSINEIIDEHIAYSAETYNPDKSRGLVDEIIAENLNILQNGNNQRTVEEQRRQNGGMDKRVGNPGTESGNNPTDQRTGQDTGGSNESGVAEKSPLNPPQGDLQSETSPQPLSKGEGQTSPNLSQGGGQSATPKSPEGDLKSATSPNPSQGGGQSKTSPQPFKATSIKEGEGLPQYVDRVVQEKQIHDELQHVNTEPTDAQKTAGNYKKGHITVQGMDITIENPVGSVRRGTDEDGKAWEHTMQSNYGYFKRTEGKDGDHIDVFVGPDIASDKVFVVDQNKTSPQPPETSPNPSQGGEQSETSPEFDESKVMLGYNSADEAKAAYLENYDPDWKGFRAITEVPVDEFKKWLYDGAKQRKPFSEYVDIQNQEPRTKNQELVNDDVRFRIIGERGAARMEDAENTIDNLRKAKEMDAAGKQPKEIRIATGWEKGVDGLWKYEVPDMRIDITKLNKEDGTFNGTLTDVLHDDTLFETYPNLRDTKIYISPRPLFGVPFNGRYIRESNELEVFYDTKFSEDGDFMGLNDTILKEIDTVIVHELQHFIQSEEGFASGANPVLYEKNKQNNPPSDFDLALRELLNARPSRSRGNTYDYLARINPEKIQNPKLKDLLKRYQSGNVSRDEMQQIVFKNHDEIRKWKNLPHDMYNRTAGEVEARNASARMNMSPEERRNTLLSETADVAPEDQIVLMAQIDRANYEMDAKDYDTQLQAIKDKAIADGTFMKAPNGKDTNLNKQQWLQVRTPEFKQWFGDWEGDPENASKVVDENGEPLVVYHGTNADFNEFKDEIKEGNTTTIANGYGYFFTPNKELANKYGNEVKPVFLNIRNYKEIMPGNKFSIKQKFVGSDALLRKEDRVDIESQGYDGFYLPNYSSSKKKFSSAKNIPQYVAFSPTQIKSATGNTGAFDKNTPDIRFRISGERNAKNYDIQQQAIKDKAIADGTFMKAPNGKDTNLNKQQWLQVRTPEFKQWFGDWEGDPKNASKVVDENGEPMVVYHDTNRKFTAFDREYARGSADIEGIYFSDVADPYHEYGDNRFSVFLNIKNPATYNEAYAGFRASSTNDAGIKQREKLQKQGYDGFIATQEDTGLENGELLVFEPTQIKSATVNTGAFDGSNPDIRFRVSGERDAKDYDTQLQAIKDKAIADGMFMKAPNGKDTNLNERQWLQVRTPEFKQWFGDWEGDPENASKVVDENGEPRLFTHETNKDFTTFKDGFGSLGRGIYFMPYNSRKSIQWYGNNNIDVFLNIKKPALISDVYNITGFDAGAFGADRILREKGYDGLISNTNNFGETIAFEPTQIKLATGNTGAFDGNNPDIRFRAIPDVLLNDEEYVKLKEALKKEQEQLYNQDNEEDFGIVDMVKQITGKEDVSRVFAMRYAKRLVMDYEEAQRVENKNMPPQIKDGESMKDFATRVNMWNAMRTNIDNARISDLVRSDMLNTFTKIRRALSEQKQDLADSVKSITHFAKQLIDSSTFDEMTLQDIREILTQVNNASTRKNIEKQLNKIENIVLDRMLQSAKVQFSNRISIKIQGLNPNGVSVAKGVDDKARVAIQTMRSTLNTRKPLAEVRADISEKTDDLMALQESSNEADKVKAISLSSEIAGLRLAANYMETVMPLQDNVNGLDGEIEQMLQARRDARKQGNNELVKQLQQTIGGFEEQLREQKSNLIQATDAATAELEDVINNGIDAKRSFEYKQKMHQLAVLSDATRDLDGVTPPVQAKIKPNGWLETTGRFIISPLGSFAYQLQKFGLKAIDGKGYLYYRFVPGIITAADSEYKGLVSGYEKMDAKANELFGKDWVHAMGKDSNTDSGITVTISNQDGETQNINLTNGQAMYIYMVNKMSDGKTKLRNMGVLEETVAEIADRIDPKFITLADWIQNDFLPGIRGKYNATYLKVFGTQMAKINNYVPLKIADESIHEDVDVINEDKITLPSTLTGSLIARTINKKPVDIMNTDAMALISEHLKQMEKWNAFIGITKDINTLLSSKRFKSKLNHLNKNNYTDFRKAANTALGLTDNSKVNLLDKFANIVAKGFTAAKISLRLNTAIKQVLSMPAFATEGGLELQTNMVRNFTKLFSKKDNTFKWAIDNLPLFDKRWGNKFAGNEKLTMDGSKWEQRLMELAKIGMTPNAAVDAMTCVVGARSLYEYKMDKYKKMGISEDTAKQRAMMDATVAYNSTQQSGEELFLAPIQVNRTFLSTTLTVFRNNAFAYQRIVVNDLKNINKYYKEKNAVVAFEKERLIREYTKEYDGERYNEDGSYTDEFKQERAKYDQQAQTFAEREVNRAFYRSMARAFNIGVVLTFLWGMGNTWVYSLLGSDDDKKKEDLMKSLVESPTGLIQGLIGGDLTGDAWTKIFTGESFEKIFSDNTQHPMITDMNNLFAGLKKAFKKDPDFTMAAWQLIQFSSNFTNIDFNTVSNIMAGLADMVMTNKDLSWKQVAVDLSVIANAPNSQTKKLAMELKQGDSTQFIQDYTLMLKKYGPLYLFESAEKRTADVQNSIVNFNKQLQSENSQRFKKEYEAKMAPYQQQVADGTMTLEQFIAKQQDVLVEMSKKAN